MKFSVEVSYQITPSDDPAPKHVTLHGGLTTLVGPNGSGKTQILRSLKLPLQQYVSGRAVRFLPAGRLAHLEAYRSDIKGLKGPPQYDQATFGGKEQRSRRHNMEGMLASFHALGARPDLQIKVRERLKRLFKRDLILEWDAGNLKANFARLDFEGDPYSAAREASALLQLVVLLAELYDDEVGALLIDEPEVSFHPQLQAFLLREIHRVAGNPDEHGKKLILMATHSTEMIEVRQPEDLASIVFCYEYGNQPKQFDPNMGELRNRQLRTLLAHMGQEHKLAFFSGRPVLLEGVSDLYMCTGIDWCLDLFLEAAGAQLLPVTGKGQLAVVSRLMRLIGKAPIVIADADAIADNLDLVNSYSTDASANAAAAQNGFRHIGDFASSVRNDFSQIVEQHWGDIERSAVQHPYWLNRNNEKDELVSKRRAAFATLMAMNDQEVDSMANSTKWRNMRQRLTALLDVLEKAGCFILRRGTIESYYRFSDTETSMGKPSAALDEVRGFSQEGRDLVEASYADLVRALRYASDTQPIDEARAVRDLVLTVAAPALANMSSGMSESGLNVHVAALVGESASILKLSTEAGSDGAQHLVIDLDSQVLDISGFPIRLRQGLDPIVHVNDQLGIADGEHTITRTGVRRPTS